MSVGYDLTMPVCESIEKSAQRVLLLLLLLLLLCLKVRCVMGESDDVERLRL